jgi:uncharacterized protein
MKTSIYNFYIPIENNYVFFNGITKKFIVIHKQARETAMNLVLDPLLCQQTSEIFYKKLIETGLVVDENIDEMDIIRTRYYKNKNEDYYLLIILPTYSCNFSCWYCIQHHRVEVMNKEIQDAAKVHIATYLLNNKIKLFELSWFGGEPLLCFNTVIKNIAEFAQKFCREHGIVFKNSITTNGYLISEEKAREMLRLGFRDYQITIDGARDDHNQTRNNNGHPSFDVILKNICILCEVIPTANITLRFNYNDTNIKPEKIVNDVNSIISEKYRNRIHILPRKVWQINADHSRVNSIDKLVDMFRVFGYRTYPIDIAFDFSSCYADKTHYNAIYPNGAIGKCTTHDIDDVQGRLKKDGSIEWSKRYLEDKIDIPLFENKMCLACKYLPVCMGPCPKDNGLKKIDIEKIECPYSDVDATHEDEIIRYCVDVLKRTNQPIIK